MILPPGYRVQESDVDSALAGIAEGVLLDFPWPQQFLDLLRDVARGRATHSEARRYATDHLVGRTIASNSRELSV